MDSSSSKGSQSIASSSLASSRSENQTGSTLSLATSTTSDTLSLPWIQVTDPEQREPSIASTIAIDTNVKPGQYVLQSLFAEFTIQAERKIEKIMAEPLESPLAKYLQRGEDPQFDQLLSSLSAVAEHCLPSLLRTLFDWYDLQNEEEGGKGQKGTSKTKGEKDFLSERRDLAVDFLFCLVLIEVLKQLPVHPVPDSLINHIETLAFKHFKHREGLQAGPNTENFHIIADLYAEVLGVLAHTRFMSVRKRFLTELKELRSEPQNVQTTQAIISLIMGMKFYRVKMFPVEDFEASFQLLHECANYYLEVKDKDIKHALAGLLVEILVPVAARVKNEVNIPVLKNFVDKLYQTTLDQCGKKKHALAAFPLVTCLLCVSQKSFFLSNWHNFLGSCLTHLKHRDPKMSRVALESLYRLLWVYMIRIKCESNTTTGIRLQSIIKSLFPSNSKYVVPRDTPLNIFVKIIQFIAQEKLEFAMKDVIFDLLGVHSKQKMICPERMNIGLRAFLVIADSLQQKDGVPPMPTTARIMPSGNTLRVRKTFLNKQLTEDAAKSIGVLPYYPSTRKALDNIIRSLDQAVGRNLLMTNAQCVNKELDDLMTSERKPKIELFRTSVAAIPRVIPDGMSRKELLELLSRLTVHRDDELRGLAFTALQNVIVDLPEWREDVLSCFINFILREVYDTFPLILESALKMLLQLLTQWKTTVQSKEDKVQVKPPYERNPFATILNMTEGFALVFLCSCRPLIRRLSYFLLKEVRALFGILGYSRVDDDAVIDVIDRVCPYVVESFLNQLPPAEKATITAATNIDLHWVLERSINQWSGSTYESTPNDSLSSKSLASRGMGGFDPWITCLARFFDSNCLPHYCPSAVNQAWPVVHTRLMQLYSHIDPNAPSEGRTSIRSKKTLNPMDDNIALWRNYLVFACSCAPPSSGYQTPRRCLSPEPISGNDGSSHSDKQDVKTQPLSSGVSAATLFKMLVPLIRCDNTDTREAVVNGLGWTNTFAFRDLIDELQTSFMKDAVERKQENMRRKRRRDFLRVHLIRVFELIAEHQVFKETYSGSQNKDGQALHSIFVDYIEGMRLFLESEGDKDSPTLQEIRLHYASFIHRLIRSISPENRTNLLPRDVRYSVFFLCGSWCRRNRVTHGAVDRSSTYKDESISDLEMEALQAMGALLVCGEVFDPNAFTQEGYLYSWLDNLLNCNDDRVHQLGKETFMLLLENNPQLPMVLQWGTLRCYTGPQPVANGYFQAMATVLNNTEDYPCDPIQTLCVILFKTADPCSTIRNMALRLLQVMDKRFFSGSDEGTLKATYGKSHTTLSHDLARLHPEQTMPVFLEITERFESAPLIHRKIMLECLQPWLYNIELTQGQGETGGDVTQTEGSKEKEPIDMEDHDYGSPLKRLGWGSKAATDIVLNNLFFITAEYGDDHAYELGQLWATLCTCWPGNLRVILNYLMMLAGVMTNPDLLPYVKRVMTYIGRAKPQKLMDELMKEMLSIDAVNSNVERTDEPPYFQLFDQSKTSEVSGGEMGSMASLIDKVDKRKEKDDAASDRLGSERSGTEKAASEKGSGDGGSHEKGTQVQEKSLLPGKGTSGHTGGTEEVWKERDKSSSTLTRSEGSGIHHSSNSSLATLTSSTSHSSSSTTTGGSVEKPKVTPASVIQEEEEQEPESVEEKETEEKIEEMEKDLFLHWRQQVLGLGVVVALPLPDDPYCAPLCDFINDNEVPPAGILHRCHLATILMTDLVGEKLDIDWSIHLPHILHVVFLGLDHSWSMAHEHCKRLLLNLLIVLAPHNDFVHVAQTLLSYHSISEINALTDPHQPTKDYNFTGGTPNTSTHPADVSSDLTDMSGMGSSATLGSSTISVSSSGSTATVIPSGLSGMVQINVEHLTQEDEAAKALVEFLVTRKCRPLWCWEEITPRVFTIKSAEQMETFLRHVVRIFQGSARGAHLEQRWAQVALQLALSCPSRHYAGRSFQIFRGLKPPLTSCMLSNILARLVETVADQGEENQGYVTEILLTLEAAIDNVTADLVFTDVRERQRAGSSRRSDFRRSTSNLYYNLSPSELRAYTEHRGRSATTSELDKSRYHRSRSSQSLKMSESTLDDKLNLLAQLFWVFVSLLESDYEYEFLMALRCLDKLLRCLPLDQSEIKTKLEVVCAQLHWENFPGLQGLLLKGFTSSLTTELTQHLVARLTVYTHLRVVDPTQAGGFPLNIVALLPYLIQHFESPDRFACEIASNIGKVCQERYQKMAPLSTVLGMYRERTYNRDSKAWTSVVCKYLHNAYSQFSIAMMTFLIEVLEKGPMSNQASVLQIVYNLLHNIDLMAAPMQQVNDNLLRVIAKYVQGVLWQESLNILKVAVSKSSSIVKPPTIPEEGNGKKVPSLDMEIRKELPGRTMEFTFDLSRVVEPGSMSNTPVIRRKFPSMVTITTSFSDESATSTLSSDDSSLSTEPTELTNLTGGANGVAAANQNVVPSAWRKPQLSQRRTRERLCSVLKGLGQKEVGFARSPSVIFSSTSDIAEPHPNSLTSSESTSAIDKEEDEQDFTGGHRYFDFLDVEEENPMNEKGFNWFDSRHSLDDMDGTGNQIPDDDHKDTSDDESITGTDDMPPTFKGSGGMQYFFPGAPGDGPEFQRGDRADSRTGSYSSGSDADNTLPPTVPARSSFIYIPVDEVEEVWRAHVDSILSDATGRCAVNTCHIFTQLYKVMQQRFCNLTREACNYLGDKLRGIALQFLNTLDVLTTHAECPFVYLDTDTLANCRLLDRQKRCVIELQEHYYTYISKRDSTVQCLDSIKSSLKLHSLGAQEIDAPSGDEQQIELCRRLYRLYCQLRMLFDSYCKLVNILSMARQSSQDFSREVSAAKEELIQAAQELESGQASLSPDFDASRMTPDSALVALAERLGNRGDLRRALRFLHVCRSMWSGDLFGSSEEDDQDVLLALLCKKLTEGKSGVLVITRSSDELSEACNKLMDTNMQLMASLKVTETLETKDVVSLDSTATTPITDAARPLPQHQEQQQEQEQQQPQEQDSKLQQVEEKDEADGNIGKSAQDKEGESDDTKKEEPVVQTVSETVDVVEVLCISEHDAEQASTESMRGEDGDPQPSLASEDAQPSVASEDGLAKGGCSPDEGYGPDIASSVTGEAVEEEPQSTEQTESAKSEEFVEPPDQKDVSGPQMKTSESGIEIPAIEISPVEEEPSMKLPFDLEHSRNTSTASDIEATTAIAVLEQAVQQAYESMTKQVESSEPLSEQEDVALASSGDDLKTGDDQVTQDDSSHVSEEQMPQETEEMKHTEEKKEEVEKEEEGTKQDEAEAGVDEQPEQGDVGEDDHAEDEGALGSKTSSLEASTESLSTDL